MAGKVVPIERRYLPASGSEGYDFEELVCGRCDHYRYLERGDDAMNCNLGIIDVAYSANSADQATWPPEWVYRGGRPTCKKWTVRKAGADAKVPLLCGGALTPEREREAYERVMRGDA